MSKGLLFWIVYVVSLILATFFGLWSWTLGIIALLIFLVGWATFGFIVK